MRLRAMIAGCVVALGAVTPAGAQTCPKGENLREGTVKFFNEMKGYGFITPSNGGADVFVHHTALGSIRIKEKDRVVFEIEDKGKGPVAVNIRLCS